VNRYRADDVLTHRLAVAVDDPVDGDRHFSGYLAGT
jgi:hypothetical protein